jgi:hypothetical protein
MNYPQNKAVFTNGDLIGSYYKIVIEGQAENPVITIGDIEIALNVTVGSGATLTIDSRNKTLILSDGTSQTNVYGYRDVAVDIFKKIPYGEVNVKWDSNFAWTLTLYDERTAPPWT